MAGKTIAGTVGLLVGFMVIKSIPDIIRYVKISMM
jgi:hypothetical protein